MRISNTMEHGARSGHGDRGVESLAGKGSSGDVVKLVMCRSRPVAVRSLEGERWSRDVHRYLFFGILAFSTYMSWMPFDFEYSNDRGIVESISSRMSMGTRVLSRTDLCVNFSYFLLAGIAGANAWIRGSRSIGQWLGMAVLVEFTCVCVSICNEVGQVWLPERVPSLIDIAAQATGCACGITLWCMIGRRVDQLIARKYAAATPMSKADLCLYAYVVIYYGICLAPFDVVVSVDELAAKWRRGQIDLRPLGGFSGTASQISESLLQAFLCLPLGIFGSRYRMPKNEIRPIAESLPIAIFCIVFLEVSQILIASRYSMVWHVIVGSVGAGMGVIVCQLVGSRLMSATIQPTGVSLTWLTLAIVSLVLPTVYTLWPLDFTRDMDVIKSQLQQVELFPFISTHTDSPLKAMTSIEKTLMMVPFGICAGGVLAPMTWEGRWVVLGVVIILICVMIEIVQIALPGRYADMTSVILTSVGGLGGGALSKWILAESDN